MQVGAQPSDTVRSLFQHQGIMDKFAKTRQGKATAETAGKAVTWKARKPKIHKKKKESWPRKPQRRPPQLLPPLRLPRPDSASRLQDRSLPRTGRTRQAFGRRVATDPIPLSP